MGRIESSIPGYNCLGCGRWVESGLPHICPGGQPSSHVSSLQEEIACLRAELATAKERELLALAYMDELAHTYERALHCAITILGELEAHQENTGEWLEEEDAAIVAQCKEELTKMKVLASRPEAKKSLAEGVTPDNIVDALHKAERNAERAEERLILVNKQLADARADADGLAVAGNQMADILFHRHPCEEFIQWNKAIASRPGAARKRMEAVRGCFALVNSQAEDEGLWYLHPSAAEGYVQQELRKLHAAVEFLAATFGLEDSPSQAPEPLDDARERSNEGHPFA